ncbi:MAG: hypothetical protein U0795_19155 [Pirellulales bacterium]
MVRTVITIISGLFLVSALALPTPAQNPPEPSADNKKLESVLDEGKFFYRKSYNEPAQRWEYNIAWEQSGETSMINIYLRNWGSRGDGSKINVVYLWATVAEAPKGETLSPELIKLVASSNDNVYTGNFSTSGNAIVANSGFFLTGLSKEMLELSVMDLHANRVAMKKEAEKIVADR